MGNAQTKESSFINAAASGDVQYVRQCMQADGRDGLLTATTGFISGRKTALHLAAKQGNSETVAAVLEPLVTAVTAEIVDGAYPGKATELLAKIANQQDSSGRTPLLTACHHGHWACAELLLEAGSNVFAADKDGNGALHLAAVSGHAELTAHLLEKAEAQAITMRLATAVNLSGLTALHYAAWSGSAEIVRLLLAARVDQLQTSWGEYDRWLVAPPGSTALHVAAVQHHSGICLLLLQSYALQLREWLPGGPVPTDPRTRPDNKGELPVEVAVRTGLHPSSQLALCLQPAVDVLSIFDAQQLDEMRRRGPPALRSIAFEALRATLLHQLGNLQDQHQLLLQQQQIEKQLQQQQQQRRQHEQEGVHDSSSNSSNWQRWWSRHSIDKQRSNTAAGENPNHPSNDFGRTALGGAVSSSSSSSSNNDSAASHQPLSHHCESNVDRQHAELVHRLNRTPSITLGAVQYVQRTADTNSKRAATAHHTEDSRRDNGTWQQQQQSEGSAPAAAAAACVTTGSHCSTVATRQQQITAPAGTDDVPPVASSSSSSAATKVTTSEGTSNLSPAAAAGADGAAAYSLAATESSPDVTKPERLLKTASITLGYLDRVWTFDKAQQQQQQHEDRTAAKLAESPESACEINCSTSGTVVCSGTDNECLGEIEAILAYHHEPRPPSPPHQQHQQQRKGVAATVMSAFTHSSSRSTSMHLRDTAEAATPVAVGNTYQHINDLIHQATGSVGAFVMADAPPQKYQDQQQDGNSSSNSSGAGTSSSAGVSSATEPSNTGHLSNSNLQWPTKQDSSSEPVEQQRPLHTSSITLAVLGDSNSTRALTAAADDSRRRSRYGHGPRFRRPQTPEQVLERAGIKGKTWQEFMTPRSWLLYQQQLDDVPFCRQRWEHKKVGSTTLTQPSNNSTRGGAAAAGQLNSSSNNGVATVAARRAPLLSNLSALPNRKIPHTSPHRRSFELAGASSSGMAAVFGANRRHVLRMLREAGTVDPGVLHKPLSRNQGSLAVATSLAGGLPGCVSEKLVQVLDVSRSRNASDVQANSNIVTAEAGCASASLAQCAMKSRLPVDASADGGSMASNCSEVCAICFDKLPAVGLAGCGHTLCFECTKCIVGGGVGCRAPLCPFCRYHITGFGLAAAAAGVH